MQRGKNKDWKLAMIALLIVSSVAITIGYASFSQILTIMARLLLKNLLGKLDLKILVVRY